MTVKFQVDSFWFPEENIEEHVVDFLLCDVFQGINFSLTPSEIKLFVDNLRPKEHRLFFKILLFFSQTFYNVFLIDFDTILSKSCYNVAIIISTAIAFQKLVDAMLKIVCIIFACLHKDLNGVSIVHQFFCKFNSVTKLLFTPELIKARLMNE